MKLIVTADAAVTNQITHGTNRQTEVKSEAFESLTPFQKKLEEFYDVAVKKLKEPIYYERRSKQHDHLDVRQDRIITLPAQLKCFLAMFLNEPQSTHRYYGELLSAYSSRLFGEAHSPMPYFVGGVSVAAIDRLFNTNRLTRQMRRFKYQILMAFRLLNEASELPYLNSRAIEKYCQHLLEILNDENESESQFKKASALVEAVWTKFRSGRESPERTKAFTTAIIDGVGAAAKPTASTSRLRGRVKKFSETLGWGFIAGDDKTDYFVHYSGIAGRGYRLLWPGQEVEFTAVEADRGPEAVDVQPID